MHKSYSQACENNKNPILMVIGQYFQNCKTILEIGSGTGQHAVCFAKELPFLTWQTSDVEEHHAGIHAWIADSELDNVLPPLILNVDDTWPAMIVDGVFSANTTHIMSWINVVNLFSGVAGILTSGGYFCLYGPFNFKGEYTSVSNQQFDTMLRARDPLSGLRNFEDINQLALNNGLEFVQNHSMPANNRILAWQKK